MDIGNENMEVIKSLLKKGESKTFIAKTIGCQRRTLVKIMKHNGLECDRTKKEKSPNLDNETTRECTRCKSLLDLNDYYKVKGKTSRICKECHKKKSKKNYDKKVSAVAEYKSNCGCAKCGETRPYVLEFHHRDPFQKDYTIANRARASLDSIMSEIQKCVVLCSNCHQAFHHLERQYGITIEDFLNTEVIYFLKSSESHRLL